MASIWKLLESFENNPKNVRFIDCMKVCTYFFGKPSIHGSHHLFRTPWQGEPWVNIQNKNGTVAAYQVKQVLDAIGKLKGEIDV